MELIGAKAQVQILEDRLKTMSAKVQERSPRPESRSRSKSLDRSPRAVDFEPVPDSSDKSNALSLPEENNVANAFAKRHNLIIDDLQREISQLKDENNNIKSSLSKDKALLEQRLKVLVEKGNALLTEKGEKEKTHRKFTYLKVLRDQQVKEIDDLRIKLAEAENESLAKISFLERFKAKALQQITTFQHLLQSSVPISLLYSTKKQMLDITGRYETLHLKSESMALEFLRKEKKTLDVVELKEQNIKLELELQKAQSRLMSLSGVSSTSSYGAQGSALDLNLEEENQGLSNQILKLNSLLKESQDQVQGFETKSQELQSRIQDFRYQVSKLEQSEKELRLRLSESVPCEEFEELSERLIGTEEALVLSKDEIYKWKEMADLSQNQIRALQNIKHFERIELESLVSQVCDLQAGDMSKGEVARVKQELIAVEKEKHLALQEVHYLFDVQEQNFRILLNLLCFSGSATSDQVIAVGGIPVSAGQELLGP